MKASQDSHSQWQQRQKSQTKQLAWWTLAWVVSLAITAFGPRFIWQQHEIITAVAIGINFIVGIGMIIANKRHLAGLDELQQKIQLNAMALSLGVGLIVGISYSTLETTGLMAARAEISHLVIVMSLTYMAGIILGHRKYQ